jgi:pre-rRNA-processing protein IPI3
MLSEFFLASTSGATAVNSQSPTGTIIAPVKDAGIFRLAADTNSRNPPNILKASVTAQNSLASSRTHVFAAQATKAAMHVYNIEKNNQEAIVPLPEKITAISLTSQGGEHLILGSESGNIFVWEVSDQDRSSRSI